MSLVFRDAHVRNPLVLSLLILVIAGGLAYASLRGIEHLLVVHFTEGGIDFLGTKYDVYNIVLSGFVLLLTNFFLIYIFYERIRFFSYLLSYFSIFISCLILVAVAVIISVN